MNGSLQQMNTKTGTPEQNQGKFLKPPKEPTAAKPPVEPKSPAKAMPKTQPFPGASKK